MSSIGRAFERESSSIISAISPTGGIRPPDRQRGALDLSLAEREEISRGPATNIAASRLTFVPPFKFDVIDLGRWNPPESPNFITRCRSSVPVEKAQYGGSHGSKSLLRHFSECWVMAQSDITGRVVRWIVIKTHNGKMSASRSLVHLNDYSI